MPPARKTASRMKKTFLCPICHALLCSKGNLKTAKSATAHFRAEHGDHDPKTTCLACLAKNPSAEHRVACLTERNALRRRQHRPVQRPWESDDVRRKVLIAKYRSGFGARLSRPHPPPFEPAEEADLVRGFRLAGRRLTPGIRDRAALATNKRTRFKTVPERNLDTPTFAEYLARCGEGTDPVHLATQALISYERNRFYHLMVSHRHLVDFNRLVAENPDAAETTEFYCFCKSMNPVRDKTVDRALHLHAIARVPDFAEFKKRIWNLLPSRRGVSYKRAKPIRDLFHFYHTILYVSQQKPLHGRSEDPCKHFLANVSLSPADELRLAVTVPAVTLHVIGFYCRTKHLQHYDVRRTRQNECRSELRDVVGALDFFYETVSSPVLLERGERIVELDRPIAAGEFLLRTLGEDTLVEWARSAKNYCETLFQTIDVPVHEETRTFSLRCEGEKTWIEDDKGVFSSSDAEDLMAVVANVAETRNVRLVGRVKDVERFKEMQDGRDEDFDSFVAIWRNRRLRIHYSYSVGD